MRTAIAPKGQQTKIDRSLPKSSGTALRKWAKLAAALALIWSRITRTRTENLVDTCLFCHRNNPDLNHILDENATFYARYDNYPAAKGHIEIVPKRHVESFFGLTARELFAAYSLIRRTRREIDERYSPDGYTIGVNEGVAAGRSIDHLHIHLIPRYIGDVPDPRGGIRQVVPNWDPISWKNPLAGDQVGFTAPTTNQPGRPE